MNKLRHIYLSYSFHILIFHPSLQLSEESQCFQCFVKYTTSIFCSSLALLILLISDLWLLNFLLKGSDVCHIYEILQILNFNLYIQLNTLQKFKQFRRRY